MLGFTPDSTFEELKSLITEQIQPWMRNCQEQQEDHSHCYPSNGTKVLPTRLVDVGKSQNEYVKLVQIDWKEECLDHPYLILSYCWGKGNESAKTTNHNLQSRLRQISIASLPRTIQDAITLTRMMGFRYLWIDAMCIIQATEDDAGEFETEAQKMRDYYANAECCISASVASDSSEGFLTERPLARYPIQPITLKLSSSFDTPSQSQVIKAEEDDMSLIGILSRSPLMCRGWYLQELMLSRRILHWTFHGLYLQCQSSMFLEGKAERWKDSYEYDPRVVLALPDDKILGSGGWHQLLQTFSQKKLTYERDRMYAIHGIACLLVQRLDVEYFYGIFRRQLAQGLAWHSDMGMPYPLAIQKPEGMKETGFPTWCWASNCPVLFAEIDDSVIFIRDNHPQRPPKFPIHPGNMALTESVPSRLYFTAPLLDVTLRDETAIIQGNDRHEQMDENFECRLDKSLDGVTYPLNTGADAKTDQGVSVKWLLIAGDSDGCTGLLVQEMSEKGIYQRYGLLRVCWDSETIQSYWDTLSNITLE